MVNGGKKMKTATNKDPDRELAYFKFALIAPVVQGTFSDPSKKHGDGSFAWHSPDNHTRLCVPST